ncbi:hypothetical protein FIBSPDRAFT_902938 [Athelia psychrophila]|uniref:Uncharacterized protein n=1 Tax=Athelia psychrophila TaxID=1759441 RepID=A0A167WLY0_9AGAM|nr:hypothetical protein FIBSPDRAFT_902938 [Fibularhizoctonia sp. CBS 109695]
MFIGARFLVGMGLTFADSAAPILTQVSYPAYRRPRTAHIRVVDWQVPGRLDAACKAAAAHGMIAVIFLLQVAYDLAFIPCEGIQYLQRDRLRNLARVRGPSIYFIILETKNLSLEEALERLEKVASVAHFAEGKNIGTHEMKEDIDEKWSDSYWPMFSGWDMDLISAGGAQCMNETRIANPVARTTWRWAFWSTSITDAVIGVAGCFFIYESFPAPACTQGGQDPPNAEGVRLGEGRIGAVGYLS